MSKRDVRLQQVQFLKRQERRGQNREFVWWYPQVLFLNTLLSWTWIRKTFSELFLCCSQASRKTVNKLCVLAPAFIFSLKGEYFTASYSSIQSPVLQLKVPTLCVIFAVMSMVLPGRAPELLVWSLRNHRKLERNCKSECQKCVYVDYQHWPSHCLWGAADDRVGCRLVP